MTFKHLPQIALILLVVATGCGSSDSDGSSNPDAKQACDSAKTKLSECQISLTPVACGASPSEAEICVTNCVADASCQEISGKNAQDEFHRCVAVCSGAAPDDFLCADAEHFISKVGECDGAAQCPDGSDEANCDLGGTGGSTSGTDDLPAGWTDKTAEEKCAAYVDHVAGLCSTDSEPALVASCVDDYATYAPIGCEVKYDAYIACMATGDFQCSDSDPCGATLNEVFACNSNFVQRTGCTRPGNQDDECTAENPYAVLCAGAAPEGCVQNVGTKYCCADLSP